MSGNVGFLSHTPLLMPDTATALGGDSGSYCYVLGAGWLQGESRLVMFTLEGGAYEGGE